MAHILVVEDDPGILMGLVRNLEFDGHTVSSATHGEEGLRIALDKHPEVLLLDVMLPDLDGFEICRLLRREGITIPILFLSAVTSTDLSQTSRSPMRIDPETLQLEIKSVSRLIQFRKLVFPQPDGPTIAVMQPCWMSSDTFSNATVSP